MPATAKVVGTPATADPAQVKVDIACTGCGKMHPRSDDPGGCPEVARKILGLQKDQLQKEAQAVPDLEKVRARLEALEKQREKSKTPSSAGSVAARDAMTVALRGFMAVAAGWMGGWTKHWRPLARSSSQIDPCIWDTVDCLRDEPVLLLMSRALQQEKPRLRPMPRPSRWKSLRGVAH